MPEPTPPLTDADIAEGLRLDAALNRFQGQWSTGACEDVRDDFRVHACAHYADALREVRRLREELARLRSNIIRCCFCGAACPDLPALKDHSCVCPDHPLRKGIVALEADCARLRAVAAAAEGLREGLVMQLVKRRCEYGFGPGESCIKEVKSPCPGCLARHHLAAYDAAKGGAG